MLVSTTQRALVLDPLAMPFLLQPSVYPGVML